MREGSYNTFSSSSSSATPASSTSSTGSDITSQISAFIALVIKVANGIMPRSHYTEGNLRIVIVDVNL